MKRSHLTLLATFCALATVKAFTAKAVIDGKDTKTGELPSTFYLRGSSGACTGSLITPSLILTAAHCVPKGTTVDWVLNGENIEQINRYVVEKQIPVPTAGTTSLAGAVKAHPKYRDRGSFDAIYGYDVGYVKLPKPLAGVPLQKLMLADEPGTDTRAWIGKNVVTSGYGLVSEDYSVPKLKGYKRVGEVPITGVARTYLQTTGFSGNIADGDSGGPVFFEMPGGDLVQIGVNSGSDNRLYLTPKRPGYFSLLRKETLCWIERDSGEDIPDVDCPKAPAGVVTSSVPPAERPHRPRMPHAPRPARPTPMPVPPAPAPRAEEPVIDAEDMNQIPRDVSPDDLEIEDAANAPAEASAAPAAEPSPTPNEAPAVRPSPRPVVRFPHVRIRKPRIPRIRI